MSFVSGLMSGSNGANFQATGAQIQTPTTSGQANAAYSSAQQGLVNQQNFLQALQAQNGIGNQSNVYNQMQGVANGTGPNPAQAMLSQQTGANVANQAALMAGQRGAGANVGLMARQAAQQGAATQQQAVGQGATMQANQSMNALNNMGSIANQQVANQAGATSGYTNSAQNEQSNLLNAIQGQNNAQVANQSNANNVNASIAQGNQAFQSGLVGGAVQGLSSAGGMLSSGGGGAAAAAGAKGGMATKGGIQNTDGQMAPKMYDDGGPVMSGPSESDPLIPNAGAPNASSMQDSPTQIQMDAAPQQMSSATSQPAPVAPPSAPESNAGQNLKQVQAGQAPIMQGTASNPFAGQDYAAGQAAGKSLTSSKSPSSSQNGSGGIMGMLPMLAMLAAEGGKVPALVSPGERYLPPDEVKKVKEGKKAPMEAGEKIPGKAKVKGAKNSYANDTVPKTLEEGGIVLPRSVTQSAHPQWAAHKFMSSILKEKALTKGKK